MAGEMAGGGKQFTHLYTLRFSAYFSLIDASVLFSNTHQKQCTLALKYSTIVQVHNFLQGWYIVLVIKASGLENNLMLALINKVACNEISTDQAKRRLLEIYIWNKVLREVIIVWRIPIMGNNVYDGTFIHNTEIPGILSKSAKWYDATIFEIL